MKRVRLAILAAALMLLSGLAYLFSNAAALNTDSLRSEIAAHLSIWSGGRTDITGPVRLTYFPEFGVTTGHFAIRSMPNIPYLKSLEARGIRIKLGLFTLLSPKPVFHRITFTDPKIFLETGDGKTGPPAQGDAPSFERALRSIPIRQIAIVNGTIGTGDQQSTRKITALNADATISLPAGTFTTNGSATWREQPVDFELTGSAPKDRVLGAKAPLTLSLRSPLVSADADAEASLANGLRATGTLNLEIKKLRQFARWLGLLIPDGRGLDTFQASGAFQLHGQRFGFDQGTFTLDGNRALGALALDASRPRPAIEGTLAFSAIDLRPYEKPSPKRGRTGTKKAETKKQPEAVNLPLLHHLDFDLRLSTSDIVTTHLTLGQVALSAVVNAGRLVADFAVLDICGGQGSGRLTFDPAVPQSQFRLTGTVTGLAAAACSKIMVENPPLAADLDLTVNLWSKGRTREAILHHLGGKVMASAKPGELAVDLLALEAQSPPVTLSGWETLAARATPFSKASAELIFRHGTIYSNDLTILSGSRLYSTEGTVNLMKRSLDIRIAIGDAPGEAASDTPVQSKAPKAIAVIAGPWSHPKISVNAPPSPEGAEKPDIDNGNRPR
jgi:uncharacterized protein involved in outer membrane biogenesis